jgi:hypothetical protein
VSRHRINPVAAKGAPDAAWTNIGVVPAKSTNLAPAANPGAHAANALAAVSAMAMLPGPVGGNLAQLPPERALAIAQALEQLAGEYRLLAGSSRGDLASLARAEPCHDSMGNYPETVAPERDRLTLTTNGLANMLGVHPRTIQRMRTAGEGPKPIGVRGALRYRRKDVERWLEGKRR